MISATDGGRTIGRVAALRRFPVKSMRAERLDEAELRWSGFRGDREYGFVLADRLRRFPWATGRALSAMPLYAPRAAGRYGPSGLPVEVTTPDGRTLSVGDPSLADELGELIGRPVRAIQLSRGTYDSMPLSVLSTGTVVALDKAQGGAVDPERFRMNVLVDAPERDVDWRGSVLAFGEEGPRVVLVRPVERCAMITIDPGTGERDPSLLRLVAQGFGNEVGEYGSVLREGVIRLGDEVRLLPLSGSRGVAAPRASG